MKAIASLIVVLFISGCANPSSSAFPGIGQIMLAPFRRSNPPTFSDPSTVQSLSKERESDLHKALEKAYQQKQN